MGSLGKSFAFLLVFVFIASLVSIQPVTVKASSPKTITIPDDYSDIQTAINHANDGDTVFVKSGHYILNLQLISPLPLRQLVGLNINKSISLIGESSKDTFLTVKTNNLYRLAIVRITSENVIFSNFTLYCNQADAGIDVLNSSCRIISNSISNAHYGIGSQAFDNEIISGNNITNNDTGIISRPSDSIISGNNIASNSLGVYVALANNVTVKENNITNNSEGLRLDYCNYTYVYGNNILGNSDFGLGIFDNCSNTIIHNNNLERNSVGITLGNANINGGNGKWDTIDNQVYFNNIIANNQAVSISETSNVISWDNGKVGNYWSDYNGNGSYVIGQNNVDRYPLTQQIDITVTAPTPTPAILHSQFPLMTYVVISGTIVILAIIVSMLFLRQHRKKASKPKA